MLPRINRLTKTALYAMAYGASGHKLRKTLGRKRLPARKVARAIKEARLILNSLS